MRCMSCGEEMALVALVPHEAIAGFAHHTFRCPGCGASERRLTFVGVQAAAAPASSETTPAMVEDPPPCAEPPVVEVVAQPPCAQPQPPAGEPDAIVSAPAWLRAVEKVRNRQADLHARADEKKKKDWISQFNQAWEKLAPAPEEPAPRGAAARPVRILAWNSKQALRAKVRRLSPAAAGKRAHQPVIATSPEALQQFNRLWDSLVPRPSPPAPESDPILSAALPALPRSLSLVPVEAVETLEALEAMDAASRVLLLLRGAAFMGP